MVHAAFIFRSNTDNAAYEGHRITCLGPAPHASILIVIVIYAHRLKAIKENSTKKGFKNEAKKCDLLQGGLLSKNIIGPRGEGCDMLFEIASKQSCGKI